MKNIQTKTLVGSVVLTLIALSILSSISHAQFGEVAGQLFTNVTIGSSNSVQFTLVNSGTSPISFYIVPPIMKSGTANAIAPNMTIIPMNGTVAPNSEFTVNISVSIPASTDDKPGTQWVGVLQAVVLSNSSVTGSGANIHEGIAKIITVTAIAPIQPPVSPYLIPAVVAIVAIVAIAAIILVALRRRKGKGTAKRSGSKR